MRFKTEIKTRKVMLMIDGHEEEVDQKYEVKVPVLPRDWDDISTKVGFGLVGVLTLISVVWSTVSIGSLLGGGVGFMAALLFDISWAVCLLLEWKARYDASKRTFPRALGWALLIVTMTFIGWHGLQQGDVALAVVGACVSLFAKVLWLGIMKHVDRNLSDEHRQWVVKTISEANARMAVAQVMRQVARMEDDAVAERLAIEYGRSMATPPTHTVATIRPSMPTPPAHTVAEYAHTPGQNAAEYGHTVATPPEPSMATPPEHSVGEYGHTVAEYEPEDDVTDLGYDRDTAITEMVKMIKEGNGISYNEAERMFGRPRSTVVGWVKAARKEAQ